MPGAILFIIFIPFTSSFFVNFASIKKKKALELLFFDMGSGEIMLIVIAIFIIFGPSKIPELARGLGKFINEIKRASEDIKTEINREADKQDREKKLAEYKAKIEKDLAPDKNIGTEKLSDKNKEPETKKETPKGTVEESTGEVK